MNLRNKNGSITIFVLVGLLFMSAFLIVSYANNVNRSKIAKEQFNIISDIYSNDDDEQSYTDAYTDLRNKNKQIMTASTASSEETENTAKLELTKTFEDKISNYRIYGNSVQEETPSSENQIEVKSVGELVTNISDDNYGKYKITIRIRDIQDEDIENESTTYQEETYDIFLDEPLRKVGDMADYIDLKSGKVVRNIGVIDSYNGETISTEWMSTTGSLSVDATVYYVMDTQVEESISLPDLSTYEDYTKIEVLTDIAPSKIEVEYTGYTI